MTVTIDQRAPRLLHAIQRGRARYLRTKAMHHANRQTCDECRYWSELCAQIADYGPLEAVCLNAKSNKSGQFVTGKSACAQWASNDLGAIDDPSWCDADALAADAKFDLEG